MNQVEPKARSGFRRSLLGLVLIAVPVVAISPAAAVNAGSSEQRPDYPQVSYSCQGIFVDDEEYDDVEDVRPNETGGSLGVVDDWERTFYKGPVLIIETENEDEGKPLGDGYDEDEFDVLIFRGDVEDTWNSEEPIKVWEQRDSGPFYYSVKEGTYTVVVDYPPLRDSVSETDYDPQFPDDFVEVITVRCPDREKKVPTPTPALPQTGSSSNTLLVVAPVMVLLGGVLVLARRRLATA